MDREKAIRAAKVLSVAGFLLLLFSVYYLRYEVLTLSRIRFSADSLKAEHELKERKESYPDRMAEYELEMKDYELRTEHYGEMLNLYKTNYDEYVKRIKDKYSPPQAPAEPTKPTELKDDLANINASFREHKYRYFRKASGLAWVACAAALTMVGGLLYLLMFDASGKRVYYAVILTIAFVFMIGPSFHTILSAIVHWLDPPGTHIGFW